MSDDLPYRPCVGVALVNRDGDVFIGHRKRKRGGERLDERAWQMPQGGIDDGETPFDAARRELWEETNVRSVELIAEAAGVAELRPAGGGARPLGRPLPRPDAEMVPFPLRGTGFGDRRPPSGRRRTRRGVRRLALGARSTGCPTSWCRSSARSTRRSPQLSRRWRRRGRIPAACKSRLRRVRALPAKPRSRWDCLEIGGAGAEAVVSRLISARG